MIISQNAARLNINNTPSVMVINRLKNTCEHIERIRELTEKPILVSSGYRSFNLNKAIGGSLNSQHVFGEAADITCPSYGTPFELARLIKENILELEVDQLIYEFRSWVHVSFARNPRHQVLTISEMGNWYKPGLFV